MELSEQLIQLKTGELLTTGALTYYRVPGGWVVQVRSGINENVKIAAVFVPEPPDPMCLAESDMLLPVDTSSSRPLSVIIGNKSFNLSRMLSTEYRPATSALIEPAEPELYIMFDNGGREALFDKEADELWNIIKDLSQVHSFTVNPGNKDKKE